MSSDSEDEDFQSADEGGSGTDTEVDQEVVKKRKDLDRSIDGLDLKSSVPIENDDANFAGGFSNSSRTVVVETGSVIATATNHFRLEQERDVKKNITDSAKCTNVAEKIITKSKKLGNKKEGCVFPEKLSTVSGLKKSCQESMEETMTDNNIVSCKSVLFDPLTETLKDAVVEQVLTQSKQQPVAEDKGIPKEEELPDEVAVNQYGSESYMNEESIVGQSKPIKESKIGMRKPRDNLGEPINEDKKMTAKALPEEVAVEQYPSDSFIVEESIISKPIKESRIGMKKPREKLGERLGNKKLGCRITNPLVGISSDSVFAEEENLKKQVAQQQTPQNIQDNNTSEKDACISDSDWYSWEGWGSSIVSAASTLSKEVSRGVGTVIETVESGLGVPDPYDLAREMHEKEIILKENERKILTQLSEDEISTSILETDHPNTLEDPSQNKFEDATPEKLKDINSDKLEDSDLNILEQPHQNVLDDSKPNESDGPQASYNFGLGGIGGFSTFSSLVSGVSNVLESASNKVLLGGLDTLEKIGRKTMDVLQDGDPGLRRKRAFLQSHKQTLSKTLREARERAVMEDEQSSYLGTEGDSKSIRPVTMGLAWDGTEGPAHIEALYLVAKQCQKKTYILGRELPPVLVEKLQSMILKLKECSEIKDDFDAVDDVNRELLQITRDVELPLQFAKVLRGWPSLEESLKRLAIQIQSAGSEDCELINIQKDLYEEVANFVAQVVAVMHKGAELALVNIETECLKLATQFQGLCGCVSAGLEKSADSVCESVTRSLPASEPTVSTSITNIYLQMAEANVYIQKSLSLLVTVLIQAQAKQIAAEL